MAINAIQHEAIMRVLQARRSRNAKTNGTRREAVSSACPKYDIIESEIASLSVAEARARLTGRQDDTYASRLAALCAEKEQLLESLGYPADYTDPVYDCPLCQDTGYDGTGHCRCYKEIAIRLLSEQTGISRILEEENFDHFTYDYYDDRTKDPRTGKTPLETAKEAVRTAQAYIASFGKERGNLYLHGSTGVGKTYLSHCIAKALLDEAYTVLYMTAFELFDALAQDKFSGTRDDRPLTRSILDCDLLIIDDLGTELVNSFVSSELFMVVNERMLRGNGTIISTNLTLNQLSELYSERIASRISSGYTLVRLTGDDIRITKKLKEKQGGNHGTKR